MRITIDTESDSYADALTALNAAYGRLPGAVAGADGDPHDTFGTTRPGRSRSRGPAPDSRYGGGNWRSSRLHVSAGLMEPWAAARLDLLAAWESRSLGYLAGDFLCRGDTRADNMIVHGGRCLLVDWSAAVTGAGWLDVGHTATHLVTSGHEPKAVWSILSGQDGASPEALVAFLAALSGFWERSSRTPAPPRSPGLRPYQRHSARHCLRLLRIGLTELD